MAAGDQDYSTGFQKGTGTYVEGPMSAYREQADRLSEMQRLRDRAVWEGEQIAAERDNLKTLLKRSGGLIHMMMPIILQLAGPCGLPKEQIDELKRLTDELGAVVE